MVSDLVFGVFIEESLESSKEVYTRNVIKIHEHLTVVAPYVPVTCFGHFHLSVRTHADRAYAHIRALFLLIFL